MTSKGTARKVLKASGHRGTFISGITRDPPPPRGEPAALVFPLSLCPTGTACVRPLWEGGGKGTNFPRSHDARGRRKRL